MTRYKLTNFNCIIDTENSKFIPLNTDNKDYRDYLIWLEEGNSPDPVELTPGEGIEGLRSQRNSLLTETDWTQLSDCPLSPEQKENYIKYRQELRDIPGKYSNIYEVVWPRKPE